MALWDSGHDKSGKGRHSNHSSRASGLGSSRFDATGQRRRVRPKSEDSRRPVGSGEAVSRRLHNAEAHSRRKSDSSGTTRNQRVRREAVDRFSRIDKEGRRHLRKRRLIVALLVLALCGVSAWGGMTFYHHEQASKKLDAAIALVEEVDPLVVSIDDAVASDVTSDELESLTALIDSAEDAQVSLDEAHDLSSEAEVHLVHGNEAVIVKQLLVGIEARKDMLTYGAELLSADYSAGSASTLLTDGWNLVIAADASSRDAIDYAASSTESSMKKARDANTEAIEDLDAAKEKIEQAGELFPSADFSQLLEYIAAKRTAVKYSLASDRSFLAGDLDKAAAYTKKYNTADKKAAALASELPADPGTILVDAYTALTQDMRESYSDARERAAAADLYVREYLGTSMTISSSNEMGTDSTSTETSVTDASASTTATETSTTD